MSVDAVILVTAVGLSLLLWILAQFAPGGEFRKDH